MDLYFGMIMFQAKKNTLPNNVYKNLNYLKINIFHIGKII